MPHDVKLSVNVDHVATIRQARRIVPYPDPVEAARIAENAGASGITMHLRSDRRHVQTHDVERLRDAIRGKLNLEMAATEEMLAIAERVRPEQVSLVPERPEEITTEGGLDLLRHGDAIRAAAGRLRAAGIAVSLFLDPDPRQVERCATIAPDPVHGFEINTDAYTRATLGDGDPAAELARVAEAAALGARLGLRVYAGHGLTTANVGAVAAIGPIEEMNIGHAIVARAVLVGMDAAVREMLAAIQAG